MTIFKEVTAGPKASALVSSLRSIGYSFNDAVADIVDNSISAGADEINIFCGWFDNISTLEILDNGCGMCMTELIKAMTIGAKSPLSERQEGDLGRFGLGLKTASFSQSQILEVESWKENKKSSIARWDLERVIQRNEWILEISQDSTKNIDSDSGTIVRWKILDKSGIVNKNTDSDTLARYVSSLEEHLSSVFHRFLENNLVISINGVKICSRSPFFHEKSQAGPIEKIFEGSLECQVKAYTLPHKSKCRGDEYEKNKWKESYIESQGFYVYRNNRLILGGSWFGIVPKLESSKLCRISIDIDHRFDALWDLDIKKSRAYPPPQTRKRLKELIYKWTTGSKDRQLKRRRSLSSSSKFPLWSRRIESGKIQYFLNEDNPLYIDTMEGLNDNQKSKMCEYIKAIQNTIPINSIYEDIKEDSASIEQDNIEEQALIKYAKVYLDFLRMNGYRQDEALRILSYNELYRLKWKEIKDFL